MDIEKQQLLEELRQGDENAKIRAGSMFAEIADSPLDGLSLKIIANAVADHPENRLLLHGTQQFWAQLPELPDSETSLPWFVVLFNLYNGTDSTEHLDLIGSVLGSWITSYPDTHHDVEWDLLLRVVRYATVKSIKFKWPSSLFEVVINHRENESDDDSLEIIAHLLGIQPDYEQLLASNRDLILDVLEMSQETESDWGVAVLGIASSLEVFGNTVDIEQESDPIIKVLRTMLESDQNNQIAIAGIIFGNLATDRKISEHFIDRGYISLPNYIEACTTMTAIQLQCLHLLKNMSLDGNISRILITYGIIPLIRKVMDIKVFPRVRIIAGGIARNILIAQLDTGLLSYLLERSISEEDPSVKGEIIRALAAVDGRKIKEGDVVEEYARVLIAAEPASAFTIKALAILPIEQLFRHELSLSALLEKSQNSQDKGVRNNLAYLAGLISNSSVVSEDLRTAAQKVLTNYTKALNEQNEQTQQNEQNQEIQLDEK